MKAIYFPHTVVHETVLKDLQACFSSVEMLQPCRLEKPEYMSRYIAEGFLSIRAVMADQEARLVEIWKTFQEFARVHGSKGDLKTPFFAYMQGYGMLDDERVASQIVTLMKNGDKAGSGPQKEDPASRAALFLYIAQQYDTQIFEIQKDMSVYARTEQTLVQSLLGQRLSRLVKVPFEPEAPGDHMASERLAAWTRLLPRFFDPWYSEKHIVWVSHCKPAVEQLLERTPHLSQTVHLRAFPSAKGPAGDGNSWKTAFQEGLARAIEDPGFHIPDPFIKEGHSFGGPRALTITLYAIHENPVAFFRRGIGLSIDPEFQEMFSEVTMVVWVST